MFTFSTGLFVGFVLCLVLAITIKIVENYETAQENKLKKAVITKTKNFKDIKQPINVTKNVVKDDDITGKFVRSLKVV